MKKFVGDALAVWLIGNTKIMATSALECFRCRSFSSLFFISLDAPGDGWSDMRYAGFFFFRGDKVSRQGS